MLGLFFTAASLLTPTTKLVCLFPNLNGLVPVILVIPVLLLAVIKLTFLSYTLVVDYVRQKSTNNYYHETTVIQFSDDDQIISSITSVL